MLGRMYRISIPMALAAGMVSLMALGGCGKKKGSSETDNAKRVKTWLPKKLVAHTGKIKDVSYTIQLPEGLKLMGQRKTRAHFIPKGGDQFDYPQFEVATSVWMHPSSPEDAAKKHKSDGLHKKDVILKSVAAKGGILLVYRHSKSKAVYAKLFRTKGEAKLVAQCTWIRPSDEDGPVPQLEKVAGWLEKICLTFELK